MSKPLVLTMGDPAGIGPELTISAAAKGELRNVVYAGNFNFVSDLSNTLNAKIKVARTDSFQPVEGADLSVFDIPLPHMPVAGQPDMRNAQAVVRSIELAVEACLDGRAGGVVTNPIAKHVLKGGTDFPYPGHTEFLAALCGVEQSVMMLSGPDLRVVPVTIHIALQDVPNVLTPTLLESTLRITHDALRRDFGLQTPRIAVAGLNPHAGEGGMMGVEEMTLITPVLDALKAEGMQISGPLPADTMFHPPARKNYDVAVCMYHDQALIPIKTLSFDEGVNITLGLPIVRTSPDHGTAFDIAGKGIARDSSLIAAIRTAQDMMEARS